MAKNLPVPPELEHLIEKRDDDADRRKQNRRSAKGAQAVEEKSAGKTNRREKVDRRKKPRRGSGKE